MPLRRRLALIAGVTVAVAAIVVALVSYVVVRDRLRGQVDAALRGQAQLARQDPRSIRLYRVVPNLPERRGGPAAYLQLVAPGGATYVLGDTPAPLPVDARVRELTTSGSGEHLHDAHVAGTHVRLLAVALPGGGALELARSLVSVDAALASLRDVLIALCVAGVALAAALGALAARRIVAPIVRVSRAARHIGETEDLTERIEVRGRDEVAELAVRFNAMLDTLAQSRAALDASVRAQRRLVADASHELRTPITSLRTNVEVLIEGQVLDADERRRLLADVSHQLDELSGLIGDLIDLARGDEPEAVTDDVRLDELVQESLERARRHATGVRFHAELAPVVVSGVPERLARAVNNLLDNAARHAPPGTPVEVRVDGDGVAVRDHGPGIDPADLPHVFDRFYRGAGARASPGSGLGLAIVRQVAEGHGGEATAANAPGGGAIVQLRLPAAPVAVRSAQRPCDAHEKRSSA